MTKKQERARQRRRWEKQQASAAQRRADRERLRRVGAVVGVVALVVGLLAVLGVTLGRDGSTAASSASPAPSSGESFAPGCTAPPAPLGTSADLDLPDAKTAQGKVYTATLTTTCGDIVIRLDGTKAPQATAAVVALAKANYYQDSPCHRLTTSESLKVLQCGDPTGTGSGDPGFGYGVENAPTDGAYPRGTVAMARTTDAQKGTGGQFFIVYGDSSLPDPDGYTVVGTVTSGLDIVDEVAARGVAAGSQRPDDGAPAAPISILRVAVTEEKS